MDNDQGDVSRRALRVMRLLQQLWGDDLPPEPDAELTILIDALAADDDLGRTGGYLVRGDQLSYRALALLLRDAQTPGLGESLLPAGLRAWARWARSAAGTVSGMGGKEPDDKHEFDDHEFDEHEFTTPSRLSADAAVFPPPVLPHAPDDQHEAKREKDAALEEVALNPAQVLNFSIDLRDRRLPRSPRSGRAAAAEVSSGRQRWTTPFTAAAAARPGAGEVGGFHLDVAEQTLSWDEIGAVLLGRVGAKQYALVKEELAATHPWDRALVADGFERCIRDAVPHHAQFRAVTVDGGYTWCEASARRVVDAHGKVHLVGFLQAVP